MILEATSNNNINKKVTAALKNLDKKKLEVMFSVCQNYAIDIKKLGPNCTSENCKQLLTKMIKELKDNGITKNDIPTFTQNEKKEIVKEIMSYKDIPIK